MELDFYLTPYFTYTIPSKRPKVLNLRARTINLSEVNESREFPGGPVVGPLTFQRREHGVDPWLGK